MRRWLAPLLMIALAAPALAEVRPLARPGVVEAEQVLRPMPRPGPAIPRRPMGLVIAVPALDLAGPLALRPVAPDPEVLPVLAGLLPVDPPRRGGPDAPVMVVTVSASNAPRTSDAAAAVRSAFVAVPGPALQPRKRPARVEVTPVALTIAPRLRPAARPHVADTEGDAVAAPAVAPVSGLTISAVRPLKRPADLSRRAAKPSLPKPDAEAEIVQTAAIRVNPGEQLVKPKKGSVCGDRRIRGETLAPIPAKVKGCGIAQPVRVTEVDGVRLSPAATVDCTTAKALKSWVSEALKPAVGQRGVAGLQVAASYACRSRNNIRGARVSEHGRGRAIDISAVVLGNGQVIDVLHNYRGNGGKFLRTAHKAACGIFGTTLGPGSDGYHENHLHFDTASYRSGPYCR